VTSEEFVRELDEGNQAILKRLAPTTR